MRISRKKFTTFFEIFVSRPTPGICLTILSLYEVNPCFFFLQVFSRKANNLVKWKA